MVSLILVLQEIQELMNISSHAFPYIPSQSIFLFGYAKENIVKSVRIDTFSSILRQEQAFFDRTNTGDLISRLTADCGEMAGK